MTLDPSDYTVDADSRPGRVRLASPGNNSQIVVTFWAGQATPAAIPPTIKSAILLMVGHLWNNREAVTEGRFEELPCGVEMLLAAEAITGVY